MKKPPKNDPSLSSKNSGFGQGLLIGTIAGIASYYLFGTKKGNQLRLKLIKDFDQTKQKLLDEYRQYAPPKPTQCSSKKPSASLTKNTPSKPSLLQNISQSISQLSSILPSSPKHPTPTKSLSKQFFTKSGKKIS